MGFMVVNTGRAASRAFYLNLRAQHDLFMFSRYEFDDAVTDYIELGSSRAFDGLAAAYDTARTLQSAPPDLGIVFHGVRPRLAFPFESDQNAVFLTSVRDRLAIDTVFLVVRDPDDALRSKINRQLADLVGDWVFPDLGMGWETSFTPSDISALAAHVISDPPDIEADLNVDLTSLATVIAERTHVASLRQLFESVFPEVRIVPYDRLVDDPASTFDDIAATAGFTFDNRTLVGTTLNGLVNRFLIYNPIKFDLSPGRRVRLRFEVADAIGLCDDWGVYVPLGADATPIMPATHTAIGSTIGLGVNATDLAALTPAEQHLFANPGFGDGLVEALAPIFDATLAVMNDVYRQQVYLSEVPDAARAAFMKISAADIAATHEMLQHAGAGV